MDILKIRHADIYRGLNKVFEDFSLTIPRGRSTAIIGPNGAGKTTLLKTISREIYPQLGQNGTLELFGQATWDIWELRNRLGIVSSDLQHNIHPWSVGFGVVRTGFYSSLANFNHHSYSEDQNATCDRLIRELGIDHLREKPFLKLSTGEQRRFLLARALVNDPEVLVFDEPTTGLDLTATFQYLETIALLIDQGKTIVIVTHHIHEIAPAIGHVVLLKDGQVFAEGPKHKVLIGENLTKLFDVPVKVACEDGFYRALPSNL